MNIAITRASARLEEAGVKGYSADAWYGLLAPAGTPPAVLAALERVAQTFVRAPATVEKLRGMGMEAQGTCGAPFAAQLQREVRDYSQLARALDLKAE